MIKNFTCLSLFAILAASGLNAQNVATTPTNANVLIEDFTGVKCGNCPDGHQVASQIKRSHPDNVFVVAVHAGYYATVAADKPNFIIDEGTTINDYFGISGYPSGLVNRRSVGFAGLVQGRSYWTLSSRTLNRETAPVNVWVKSTYDKVANKIIADVELYYTSDVKADSSMLCVSLLQNAILGPQAGAGDVGDEYVHNHVLRAMFTPVWGDTIATSAAGTLVKKHYEYDVPELIKNVETDPLHSDVIAYVINNNKEVLNVNGGAVECPADMTLPTTATLELGKITAYRNFADNYYECDLVNEGTEPITSADFKFTFDDEEDQTYTWTAKAGEAIPGLERGTIRIPVQFPDWVISGGCDEYKLKLTGLNGKTYAGNTVKNSFGGMINVAGDVKMLIKTDSYADDNTYRLLDADGNLVHEFGPYAEGNATTYTETIQFPAPGYYCLEVYDAWGNGILVPRGSIKWYDASEKLIAQNTGIENFGYCIYFKAAVTDGVESVHSLESLVHTSTSYNLAGQKVSKNFKGIVINNGKKIFKD